MPGRLRSWGSQSAVASAAVDEIDHRVAKRRPGEVTLEVDETRFETCSSAGLRSDRSGDSTRVAATTRNHVGIAPKQIKGQDRRSGQQRQGRFSALALSGPLA